jgi:hypothetical protein
MWFEGPPLFAEKQELVEKLKAIPKQEFTVFFRNRQ